MGSPARQAVLGSNWLAVGLVAVAVAVAAAVAAAAGRYSCILVAA